MTKILPLDSLTLADIKKAIDALNAIFPLNVVHLDNCEVWGEGDLLGYIVLENGEFQYRAAD